MSTESEIAELKKEIKLLKYALLTVFSECSDDTPLYLSKRIKVMTEHFVKNGVNLDDVISGEA